MLKQFVSILLILVITSSVSAKGYYDYKGRTTSMFKSMALPGWGQFSNKRKVAGYTFSIGMVAALGAVGYGVMAHSDNVTAYDDEKVVYENLMATGSGATLAEKEAKRVEMNNLYSDTEDSQSQLMMISGIAGAFYLYNLIDSYFFYNPKNNIKKGKLDFSFMPDFQKKNAFTVNLTYNFGN